MLSPISSPAGFKQGRPELPSETGSPSPGLWTTDMLFKKHFFLALGVREPTNQQTNKYSQFYGFEILVWYLDLGFLLRLLLLLLLCFVSPYEESFWGVGVAVIKATGTKIAVDVTVPVL